MKQGVYALYDSVAECYGSLVLFKTEKEAVRAVFDALRSPDSPISQHAEDYTLMRIGVYDDNTGRITASIPVVIVKCCAIVSSSSSQVSSLEEE